MARQRNTSSPGAQGRTVWKAMRTKSRFTVKQAAKATGMSEMKARTGIDWLRRYGYVRPMGDDYTPSRSSFRVNPDKNPPESWKHKGVPGPARPKKKARKKSSRIIHQSTGGANTVGFIDWDDGKYHPIADLEEIDPGDPLANPRPSWAKSAAIPGAQYAPAWYVRHRKSARHTVLQREDGYKLHIVVSPKEVWTVFGKDGKKELLSRTPRPRLDMDSRQRAVGWADRNLERIRNPKKATKKKTSKKKSASTKLGAKALPKAWNVYLIYEDPKHLYLHSFSSNEHIMPGAAALERSLILKSGKDGKMKVEHSATRIFTEKELRKFLGQDRRKLVPGREQRIPNPRRSLVKEALEAEATRYKKFEDFSESYWNDCSRGIYWVATNERDFVIGEPERRRVSGGKFFVACNPELALTGKNSDKKYVAELNVNMLPARSLRAKRGAASTEIKISDNIGKVRVMRTMPASKAKRAFKYQQGLLPSSKEQLRKFWGDAWKKLEEKREKQREKLKRLREREVAREKRMAVDEARAAKKRKKAQEAKEKKATKAREAKGRKAAAGRKKKATKKNPGTRAHRVPVRMISRAINNPGR